MPGLDGAENVAAPSASIRRNVRFQVETEFASATETVKGFGSRQAYESLSCSNPRAMVDSYGDFVLWPMSAMTLSTLGSLRLNAG